MKLFNCPGRAPPMRVHHAAARVCVSAAPRARVHVHAAARRRPTVATSLPSPSPSSRRLIMLHCDEAHWYWGAVASAAAAAASSSPSSSSAPCLQHESGDDGAEASAAAFGRAVRDAEGLHDLLELAAGAPASRAHLADVRRLLLRLSGMLESDPPAAAEPGVGAAMRAAQRAAASRLDEAIRVRGQEQQQQQQLFALTGDVASIVWCLAEFEEVRAAALEAVISGGGGGDGGGGGSCVDAAFVDAVSAWLLAVAEEEGKAPAASSSSSAATLFPPPLSGPDGVSLVWGLGQLAQRSICGSSSGVNAEAASAAAAATERLVPALAALYGAVAAGLAAAQYSSAGGAAPQQQQQPPPAPEDLADLAAGVAAAKAAVAAAAAAAPIVAGGGLPPGMGGAAARLLDAVAHAATRQLSNRHSGAAGFAPGDLVKLVGSFAAAGYADGSAPRMLDAVATHAAARAARGHVNAVSRPRDLAALVSAFAALKHRSVAVPELLRAVSAQVRTGVAAAHELRHSSSAGGRVASAAWAPRAVAQLLEGQMRLGYRPPAQQLTALAAALAPLLPGGGGSADEEGGALDAISILEAYAECEHHPGQAVASGLIALVAPEVDHHHHEQQQQQQQSLGAAELVRFLFALARLGERPPRELLDAAADAVALAGGGGGSGVALRARDAVRALWALAALGALTTPRFGWLLVQLAQGRWGQLTDAQLEAVAAAGMLLEGSDGAELAEEVLPAGLARRVRAARGRYVAALAAATDSGGTPLATEAAAAAAEAWLPSSSSVRRIALLSDADEDGAPPHAAASGAWLVDAGPFLPPPGGREDDRGGARAPGVVLAVLARREELATRAPKVRASGDLLLRLRVLARCAGVASVDGGTRALLLVVDDDAEEAGGVVKLTEEWLAL